MLSVFFESCSWSGIRKSLEVGRREKSCRSLEVNAIFGDLTKHITKNSFDSNSSSLNFTQ
jgi:hypothetical protein